MRVDAHKFVQDNTAILWLLFATSTSVLAGCSGSSPESFKPDTTQAREALEKTLEAWKASQAAGEIGSLSEGGPKINAVDSDWTAGKRLASYEITGERPAESGSQPFSVKLQYEKVAQPVEAVYYVIGKDPVWVFRDKDYQQSSGM